MGCRSTSHIEPIRPSWELTPGNLRRGRVVASFGPLRRTRPRAQASTWRRPIMPRFLCATAAVLAFGATGLLSPAWAEQMMFHADLSGAAQVPPVDTAATGAADVTVDSDAMTV